MSLVNSVNGQKLEFKFYNEQWQAEENIFNVKANLFYEYEHDASSRLEYNVRSPESNHGSIKLSSQEIHANI